MLSSKMLDQFSLHLQHIKAVPGVENSVLVQKDGYPISSAGVWLSENEIFGLSSSAAAILSVAQRLHDDLSYVLIEGERSKFLLATLPRAMNYFITVTTQSHSNLGALLLQLERTISYLDDALWNEQFIPPLRTFEQSERTQIYNAFNVREGPKRTWSTGSLNMAITENTAQQITEIVTDFLQALPSATTGEVCLEGGYLIPTQRYNEGMRIRNSTLTYTLFDTSRKVAHELPVSVPYPSTYRHSAHKMWHPQSTASSRRRCFQWIKLSVLPAGLPRPLEPPLPDRNTVYPPPQRVLMDAYERICSSIVFPLLHIPSYRRHIVRAGRETYQ